MVNRNEVMKQFISKVKNLSQKAAEIKAAMQQLPPKIAEVRDTVAATTGQLQQLKSEIQYSVADLKAEQEDRLSEALAEIHSSTDVFAKAGFKLSGVDLEISPVQRMLVHLTKIDDVHTSVLRSLLQANQQRRTTRAILSSLLQAEQMADTVELGDLVYSEVVVGVGPIPSVRLCWRSSEIETAEVAQSKSIPAVLSVPAVASPQSGFTQGSFFEKRSVQPAPVATHVVAQASPSGGASPAAPDAESTDDVDNPAPRPSVLIGKEDPLAKFKKMPVFSKYKK